MIHLAYTDTSQHPFMFQNLQTHLYWLPYTIINLNVIKRVVVYGYKLNSITFFNNVQRVRWGHRHY